MREGWEIKKLGEVCEVIGGSTPKTNEPLYWNGEYYWITPAELNGSKYISSTIRTITDAGVKNAHLQLLPQGTVLLSSRAPIGKVAITTVPMYCNQGFKNLVCSNHLRNEYVYWFLLYNTVYLNSLGTGATFKEISKKVVEQIPIPVPPLAEQERIVGELDLLSGVIAKKREQLTQLDALAQSIFYTMFGDPISNNKDWMLKRISDIGIILTGNTPSTKDNNNYIPAEVCFVKPSDIPKDGISFIVDTECYVSKKGYEKSRQLPKGSVLVTCIGIIGKVAILDIEAAFNQQINAIVPRNVNSIYLAYTISGLRSELESIANAPVVPIINKSVFSSIEIPIPPISLQQQFAEKIDAIEKQKERIRQSLTEVQQLFDSRMNYYFG